tara:strand:+ start:2016 stop:8192 length:6177 start_codon:yes stop_codon:yes gene_type:complete
MAKPGKPNTFFKGMKADSEEALQPKESYRFAKNARITSHEGDNVSIQPFPSDKLALDFVSEASNVSGAPALSYTNEWVEMTAIQDADVNFQSTYQTGSIGYILEVQGFNISPTLESGAPNPMYPIFQPFADIQIQGNFTEYNPTSEDNPLTLTITLTENTGTTIEINNLNISEDYELAQYSGVAFDVDTVVADAITNMDNSYVATVVHNVTDIGVEGDNCNWTFFNTDPSNENYITNITVVAEGAADVVFFSGQLQNFVNTEFETPQGWPGGAQLVQALVNFITAQISEYYSGVGEIAVTNTILNVDTELTNLGELEQEAASLAEEYGYDFQPSQGSIQILGTFSFSDYLVILGKWPLQGIVQFLTAQQLVQTGEDPNALENLVIKEDVVVKVKQSPNGSLNTNGIDAISGDFITFEDLQSSLYSVYLIADLQFTNRKKLKVEGSEESEELRRIYFTDGTFPLKTLNVGLNPIIYTPYAGMTEYFNLFSPSVFAPVHVTGFREGGSLDSIAYAYSYRYKTVDGRVSRISPPSNPASVPVTNKNIVSPAQQGRESGVEGTTNKSIEGVLVGLDNRYSHIQMIYTPYMDGSPAGPSVVFSEYEIPKTNNEANDLFWIHTGAEAPIEEITTPEYNNNQISWDICQAMQTKDNRLFCGNLRTSFGDIDTDFTVRSYNSSNQPHDSVRNPDLYHDMLYSMGGIKFTDEQNILCNPANNADGAYTKQGNIKDGIDVGDYYRYVQKMVGDTPDPLTALYTGTVKGMQPGNNVRRGIFGAESKYFNTPLPEDSESAGEYEGVRVTFRVLNNQTPQVHPNVLAKPLEIDNNAKLIETQAVTQYFAQGQYYSVSAGINNFYDTYANPVYNSNYVGYRRGEIYRFGIVFYDKNGSPMFVKRIGDIRMPEHSTEHLVPYYGANGQIQGFNHEWPYFFQTARDPKDQGFEHNFSSKPYDNQDGRLKGCILHPYFEVKLTKKTVSKIAGYAIVRVPRDMQNRTILTSGILRRAIKYSDHAEVGDHGLLNRYGNTTFPLWTEVGQNNKARFDDGKCNVYTIDSPDVLVDTDFGITGGNNRIKIVESQFCQKQNVSLGGIKDKGMILTADLADGSRNPGPYDQVLGPSWNEFVMTGHSVNVFASLIHRERLQGGESINFADGDLDADIGGWNVLFPNQVGAPNDNHTPTRDMCEGEGSPFASINSLVEENNFWQSPNNYMMADVTLGYQTKYYPKRVSCYPQYGMMSSQDLGLLNGLGYPSSSIPYNGEVSQPAAYVPFKNLGRLDDPATSDNRPKDALPQTNINQFIATDITFQKVVVPNEEVSNVDLGSNFNYRNAHFHVNLWGVSDGLFNAQQKFFDNTWDMYPNGLYGVSSVQESAPYAYNNKTIVVSIDNARSGMMPLVRQNLDNGNQVESFDRKMGWSTNVGAVDGGAIPQVTGVNQAGAGHWAPEVTVASIHKLHSYDTLYGGDTLGDFSRNNFQLTGHFTPIYQANTGQSFQKVGLNGSAVFGGDTYIGYHSYKKSWNPTITEEKCVFYGSHIPIECEYNLELRHGFYYGTHNNNIPRYRADDTNYNKDYDSENNALSLVPKPLDWKGAEHWPSTVAFSEVKNTGEISDSFAIFPPNQFRDLDYNKGPITQMFDLNDKLFALQNSGTCLLSVNPRVLIPTQDGASIQAVTGTGNVIERHDYISNFGSQHFHGLAVSDQAAYYYDDNHSKFIKLGRGKKGGFGAMSLGETALMQSYFNEYKNKTINDNPLTILTADLSPTANYNDYLSSWYTTQYQQSAAGAAVTIGFGVYDELSPAQQNVIDLAMKPGGISIGYDPENAEILLTMQAAGEPPKTIVYNENLDAFTTFLSKTPGLYFNHKARMYSVHDIRSEISESSANATNDRVFLANGQDGTQNKYLTFSGIDYYIWQFVDEQEEFKEPFEVEFAFNDIPIQSKIYDKIQLSMNSDTEAGYRYNYFRKFAFKGGANIDTITQFDDGSEEYANTDNIADGQIRTWYTVKDGFHFVPMRELDGPNGPQGKVRGNYATARLTMGWSQDNTHPSGAEVNIKNEKFNIFSVVPFYRPSRI